MEETKLTPEEQKLADARERAREKVDFITHLVVYIVVNIFLFIFNYLSSPGEWWFQWTLIGWGMGVIIHFLSAFVFCGLLGKIEAKFIKDELGKN